MTNGNDVRRGVLAGLTVVAVVTAILWWNSTAAPGSPFPPTQAQGAVARPVPETAPSMTDPFERQAAEESGDRAPPKSDSPFWAGRLLLASSGAALAGCSYWVATGSPGDDLMPPPTTAVTSDDGVWRVERGRRMAAPKLVVQLSPLCWLAAELVGDGDQGVWVVPDAALTVRCTGLHPGDGWSASWYPLAADSRTDWVRIAWDECRLSPRAKSWCIRRTLGGALQTAHDVVRHRVIDGARFALVVHCEEAALTPVEQAVAAPREVVVDARERIRGIHFVLGAGAAARSGALSLQASDGNAAVHRAIESGHAFVPTGALPDRARLTVRLQDGARGSWPFDVRAAELAGRFEISVAALTQPIVVTSDRPLQAVVVDDAHGVLVHSALPVHFWPADVLLLHDLGGGRFAVGRREASEPRRVRVLAADSTAGELDARGQIHWFARADRRVVPAEAWSLPPGTTAVNLVLEVEFVGAGAARCGATLNVAPDAVLDVSTTPGFTRTRLIASAVTEQGLVGLPPLLLE